MAGLLLSSRITVCRHRSLPAGMLLWAVATVCGAQQPATKPLSAADEQRLHTALDAYDAGNTAQAEPALRQLVVAYPRSYQATEALGSLLVETQRASEALPLLQHAASLAPNDSLAHANLGAALAALDRPHEAVKELRRAVDLSSADQAAAAAAQANLGHALLLDDQPAAAAAAFARAASGTALPQDLLDDWALASLRSGDPAAALRTLDGIAPPDRTGETLSLRADAEERLGQFQPALADFQAAAQRSPTDANLYALTVELLRHWTWKSAVEVARFGATRYPQSTHFLIAEGIADYGAGDYKGAAPVLAAVLQQQPENAAVADLLGRSCSLLAEGEAGSCRGVYTYAKAHPGNAVMTTYAAVALLHQAPSAPGTAAEPTNQTEADRLLTSALAADPRYAQAWYQLGVLRGMQLQWQPSADALEHAVSLEPSFAEAHYRLSRAYAHLGRHDDAQQQLALQQTYAKAAKADLDARLQQLVMFLVSPAQTAPSSTTNTGASR